MAYRWTNDLTPADVTPEPVWLNRRRLLAGMAGLGLGAIAGGAHAAGDTGGLEPTGWEEITSYNNFYEFGTRKDDPARNAHLLTTSPWAITIDGMVDRPGEYGFEQMLEWGDVDRFGVQKAGDQGAQDRPRGHFLGRRQQREDSHFASSQHY